MELIQRSDFAIKSANLAIVIEVGVSFHLETYQDLNESMSSFLQQRDFQEKIK